MSDVVITKVTQCDDDALNCGKQSFYIPEDSANNTCRCPPGNLCVPTLWCMTQTFSFLQGDSFKITNFTSVDFNLTTPIGDFPIPELRDFENILVKAEGNSLAISVSWVLNDEGSTIVTTTPAQTVKTVQDQLNFYINTFQPNSIEDSYTITVDNITRYGSIRSISFSKSNGGPITYDARLEFISGNVVAAEA